MKHLDLFSGIGGASLAADMVWPNVEHIFCDNDPFCQQILKKHWPNAPVYGDIRGLTAHAYCNGRPRAEEVHAAESGQQTQRLAARRCTPAIDLLTGGFPCQPFSHAGRRKGTADDRHLWPEMLRVIREFRPRWVVGENVAGFVTWGDGLVLEQACADLEAEGYEVQPFIIPAVAVNAPHRRDRVWIVGHARNLSGGSEKRRGMEGDVLHLSSKRRNQDDTHSNNTRLQGAGEKDKGHGGLIDRTRGDQRTSWSENWPEVAARLCTLDDGLPNGLARPRGWRNAALKATGNAWVPQVAVEIFKAIRAVEPTPQQ